MKEKKRLKKIGLLLLPVLLVAGLRLWALARQTPHLEQIAREIGSIPQYRVGIYPNHSGSSLIYFQETETGLGTFFCATATGKSKLLYEEKEKGHRARFRLLGWSMDDRLLVFAILSDDTVTNGSGVIKICKGDTGEMITSLPAEGYAGDSQFAWLSARAFVYSTFTHRSWLLYAEKRDGTWGQTQVVKRFTDGRLTNLVGVSSHVIAWQNRQAIWTYDFAKGTMARIWEASTNQLTGLAVSEKTGNLLLKCRDEGGRFLAELRPPRLGETNSSIVSETRPAPVSPDVAVAMRGGKFFVRVETGAGHEPAAFEWNGMMHFFDGVLHYYAVCGDSLFFIGGQADGIPGIWEYNTQSQGIRQIMSALHTPLKWAKLVEPVCGVYTNQSGKAVSYHLWPPAARASGRKYPIVIGKELQVWNPFQQAAANAGWIYAKIDLTDWDMSTWPEDMANFYQVLVSNPAIDTNKIFFLASSGQNPGVNRLVREKVGNPKGLILFHPAGLATLADQHLENVLVLGGTDDKNENVTDLRKLQDTAFNEGANVHLLIQDGVQHLTRSVASEREQTVQFARFLSELK